MNKERVEELAPVGTLLEDTLERVAKMKNMTHLECQHIVMTFAAKVILNYAEGDVEIVKNLRGLSDEYANAFKRCFIDICDLGIKIFSVEGVDDDGREKDSGGD